MPRIKVPQSDGEIAHFDGGVRVIYKVEHGAITVDDAHVLAVLQSVPGSSLIDEPVTKVAKPAKE